MLTPDLPDMICTCGEPDCFLTRMPGLGFDHEQILLVLQLMSETFTAGFAIGMVKVSGPIVATAYAMANEPPKMPSALVQTALDIALKSRERPASPEVREAMGGGLHG